MGGLIFLPTGFHHFERTELSNFKPNAVMYSTTLSSPSTTLSSPFQNPSPFKFPLHRCAKTNSKTISFPRNSPFFAKSFSPLYPLRISPHADSFRVFRCSVVNDKVESNRLRIQVDNSERRNEDNNVFAVAKPIAYALFCIFVGVFCPVMGFQRRAVAAVAAAPMAESGLREENEENGHEFSRYTRRLLEAVSRLLKLIEEAKNGGKEVSAKNVEEGLKEVKMTKMELQEEIMNGLYGELRVLKGERDALMDRSEEIVSRAFKAKKEEEGLVSKGKGNSDRSARLRVERKSLEKEYEDTWERIGEIEDSISRKETMALSIGVRELLSIERECQALVESFLEEMRRQKTQR